MPARIASNASNPRPRMRVQSHWAGTVATVIIALATSFVTVVPVPAGAVELGLSGVAAGTVPFQARALPGQAQVGSAIASVVNVVDLSLLDLPIPDPTGVTFDQATGRLFIADSEVEETGLFAGVNFFDVSRHGEPGGGGSTLQFSGEPAGVGFNPVNRHLFICDDNKNEVFEISPGLDGKHLTPDDVVTSFDTQAFGSSDPEGVEYDPVSGNLFILDGFARKLFEVDAGPNGLFEGVSGDDEVTTIDVGAMGAQDPEGLGIDVDRRVLLVTDHLSRTIYEVTRSGALFRTVDISTVGGHKVAGVTVAPGTALPGVDSVYLVFRGLDNASFPNENDGMLIEISVPPPLMLPGGTFVDDNGSAHESSIEAIAALGITKGCNPPANDKFCPNQNVTRAQMAVFLVQAVGEAGNLPSYQGHFSDVGAESWYAPWVERLFDLGVTVGFPDGTYRPHESVTRGEMAVFLIATFNHTTELVDPTGVFADVSIDAFYADDAELLRSLGITAGCSTGPLRYCPDDPVRRGHMATFLAKSLGLAPILPPPA